MKSRADNVVWTPGNAVARKPVTGGIDSLRAWTVVASAFFASSISFGIIYSFGVFLQPRN